MKIRHKCLSFTASSFVIASILATACSGPAPASPPKAAPTVAAAPTTAVPAPAITAPAAASTTVAAKPNPTATTVGPYGELKVGVGNFSGGAIDPQLSPGYAAQYIGATMFDALVGVTVEGQPAPGIAERWDTTPDAKTWTFYIRKGVKFHDGSDLTAEDVKFSIERNISPDAKGTNATNLRNIVDKIEMKDAYTIVIQLKRPDPEIWKWFCLLGNAAEGEVVPKKYIETKGVEYFRDHPIGSGPWKFVKYDFNTELQVEAVGSHWRAVPKFKKLTIRNIPEEGTRIAMLQTGELDVIQLTPAKAADVKALGLKVLSIDSAIQSGFALYPDLENPSAFPIGDVRVRKALSMALNREEIGQKLFPGFARPTALFGMAQTSPYFDGNVLRPVPYDPNQAKALLAEAGFPNGFSIKLFSSGLTSWMNLLSEAIGGYWEKIGVKTTIGVQDYAALRPLLYPKLQPELKGKGISWNAQPYPYFALRVPFYSTAFHQNHNNKDLDALIDKTEASTDMAERKKLAAQAAKMAYDGYTYNGIVDVSEPLALGKNVGVWTPTKGYLMPALEFERIPHAN